MTTKIYRNDSTGYIVTLIDNGRGARVKDSLGYDFPMVGSDYPFAGILAASRAKLNGAAEVAAPAPAQMTSPLAASEQVRMARPLAAGGAGSVGGPTLPQARCLNWASAGDRSRVIHRGRASVIGMTAPLDVLVAMSRRGWVTLDHPTMPVSATIKPAGRNALAAYIAKHGEVL